jgi:hypothetical protein
MFQSIHQQRYQEFKAALEQLRETATTPDLAVAELREQFQEIQQLFQSQIASLSPDEIAPEYASRWQSFQTEIYKQMRLLQTDLMMLQASRSPATSRSRSSGVSDRIHTLIQYCEALLQL